MAPKGTYAAPRLDNLEQATDMVVTAASTITMDPGAGAGAAAGAASKQKKDGGGDKFTTVLKAAWLLLRKRSTTASARTFSIVANNPQNYGNWPSLFW